jgi:hypothetical protein
MCSSEVLHDTESERRAGPAPFDPAGAGRGQAPAGGESVAPWTVMAAVAGRRRSDAGLPATLFKSLARPEQRLLGLDCVDDKGTPARKPGSQSHRSNPRQGY